MKYHLRYSRLAFLALHYCLTNAQSNPNNASNLSKRGLLYIGSDHPSDYNIFTSSNSPLTWYYTFSTWTALPSTHLEFVPMIHGTDSATSDVSAIKGLSNVKSVLVFNEPDGSTSSGGSNISPSDAAKVYLDTILPLRTNHGMKLSLPATTGSPAGLKWLTDFNTSCHKLNKRDGCPFDFIAAHWYGDFGSMTAWLGGLHDLYPDKPLWLTEFALPKQDATATQAMLNQSLPWLDATAWVERYAWFGAFREDKANGWTGGGVSLLGNDGGLSLLGATYLGGDKRGFKLGDGRGSGSGSGSGNGNGSGSGSGAAGERGVGVLKIVVAVVAIVIVGQTL